MRLLPAIALLVLVGCGGSEATRQPAAEPDDVKAHFTPEPEPEAKKRSPARFTTARVVRRTTLRERPGGRVVARIGRRTEFGSPRVVAVTRRREGWLRVTVSEL